MKVLFVWDSEYPWDIRVEKICSTLINHGCQVHLVCRNRSGRPLEETYDGINIHRISHLPKKFGFLNDIYSLPLFFNPVWLKKTYTVAKENTVDLIIVRDLALTLAGLLVGKILKIPVILDMAECYPEMVRLIWKYEPFKIQNLFLRNPFIIDLIEHIATNQVSHIFVTVEESKQRLLAKGVSEKKITIVSNTPMVERFRNAKKTCPGIIKQNQDKLILLYVGFLNFSRGLDTVIESLGHLRTTDNAFFLVMLGKGSAEDHLEKMALKLNVNKHISFEGWVDNKIVPEYIASSDICLVPHHKCGHWNHTIPNKLFDYMAAGKPVLVSDALPMARIVHETQCGMVYTDFSIDSCISQLMLLKDANLREKLGQNGANAIIERYNWENDSHSMVVTINQLMHEKLIKA